MDIDLKALSEFGAEFLGFTKRSLDLHNCGYGEHYWVDGKWRFKDEELSQVFFDSDREIALCHYSSMFAHLAKRELAKRKLHWYASWKWDKHNKKDIYFFQIIKDSSEVKLNMHMDENEYQALWLAIQEAVK